jgi:uncharacterized metal-binding protein YceD (DUF177 family)
VNLDIPMKKLHPRYHDTAEDSTLFYSAGDSNDNETDSDPRWNELKKIKNKD